MAHTFLRLLVLFSIVGLAAVGSASAEECSGTITADEALKAENARWAAQIAKAAVDSKASYMDSMRSGRVKYRKITANNDLKTRTYGCLALITGTVVYEVTVGGGERTVPVRLTAIWAKRPSGIEFVSGQATGIPAKQ